jgi:predicted enzyme related to lactoylglutathione lyase
MAQARDLGADVLAGPMDIPEVGRFAVLKDPQGAAFGVIKLAAH